EIKLKRQLTDETLEQGESVSDYSGLFYGIRKEMRRERLLKNLPSKTLLKLRIVIAIKFLFAAILIVEVLLLRWAI
ncbi:MAG: hypothetical protein WBQ94_24695, partial [Terracidiphilus sp.]